MVYASRLNERMSTSSTKLVHEHAIFVQTLAIYFCRTFAVVVVCVKKHDLQGFMMWVVVGEIFIKSYALLAELHHFKKWRGFERGKSVFF